MNHVSWIAIHIIITISTTLTSLTAQAGPSLAAVPLIIDTDASFDVDDVVAVCMAHALMDNGEVTDKTLLYLHLLLLDPLLNNSPIGLQII